MKRFFVTVFILFLLMWFPGQSVHAQTPTAASAAMPSGVRKVDTGGALNELLDKSESFFIEASPTGTTKRIPDVNLEAGKDFKVPKLETVASFFAAGIQFLTPYSIKQKTIDQERNLYISGRARYCKTNAENKIVEQVSKEAYKTEVIPELSLLDQASRYAAAISSRYSLSPVNGEYNYNTDREPLEIANAPACEETATGGDLESKTVKTTSLFENPGGLLGILKSIFGTSGIIHATLASKQLTPYAESMDCLITGCSANGDLSYLKSTDEQKRVKEGGGVVNTYAHITHKITGNEKNAKEANDFGGVNINTNTLGAKAMNDAANYMKCAILPKSVRAKFVASGACQQAVTTTPETTCNTGSLPAFSIKSECKLKSTSINGYTLSPKLVETIEAAASAYNVPASLMLAIMFGEGAFNGNKIYSSTAVDPYLDGCTLLPNCSGPEGNIVPLDDWSRIGNAIQIVAPTKTSNACNLTDGIFALADSIHLYQYSTDFYDNATQKARTCFGLDLIYSLDKTAKTCTDWTDNNAETAMRYWEIGSQWNDASRSCATKKGSGKHGGNLSDINCALDAAGHTDTCERYDNRAEYSTPDTISHNGYLWNAYKSH